MFAVIFLSFNLLTFGVNINQFKCKNDFNCGISFDDTSGKLKNSVEFIGEYLLENGGFDGCQWVPDKSYPKGGYLLVALLGDENDNGLYKFSEDKYGKISFDIIISGESPADVAWTKQTPNKAYLSGLLQQSIIIVDIKSNIILDKITELNGINFAGPDGITATDNGFVYWTDTDFNITDYGNEPTYPGGSIFKLNTITGEVTRETIIEFGYNGINTNNDIGNGRRLLASNTVDLPNNEYDLLRNDKTDINKIRIDEYFINNDGSLTNRGYYYEITRNINRFPLKTFLDGITFDLNNNLWISKIINQTIESSLVVINFDGISKEPEFIGEINFNKFQVNAACLAGDGYIYASLVNFPEFSKGQFLRMKVKSKKNNNKFNEYNNNIHGVIDNIWKKIYG